jgi:hypothetical protein
MMIFYDILEQSEYEISFSRPGKPENLSDLFITHEELSDLIGRPESNRMYSTSTPYKVTLDAVVKSAVEKLAQELQKSGKKSIPIDDAELLAVIKRRGGLRSFSYEGLYCIRKDRICYAKSYKRIKKKATQGDLRRLWIDFQHAYCKKYGCYPPHITLADRSRKQFEAWKKIVGWKFISKQASSKEERKFYRQIWDNPEEFMKW